MTIGGLDISTTTCTPTQVDGQTATVTCAAGLLNTLNQPIVGAAMDVDPQGNVLNVVPFELYPGSAEFSLPTPQGAWLISFETRGEIRFNAFLWISGGVVVGSLAGLGLYALVEAILER